MNQSIGQEIEQDQISGSSELPLSCELHDNCHLTGLCISAECSDRLVCKFAIHNPHHVVQTLYEINQLLEHDIQVENRFAFIQNKAIDMFKNIRQELSEYLDKIEKQVTKLNLYEDSIFGQYSRLMNGDVLTWQSYREFANILMKFIQVDSTTVRVSMDPALNANYTECIQSLTRLSKAIESMQQPHEAIQDCATLQGHAGFILAMDISHDHQEIATASADKTVKVWSIPLARELKSLVGHQDYVFCVTFSKDGQFLASGSFDECIIIWMRNSNQRHILRGHTGCINRLSFSIDSRLLYSASDDKKLKIWNMSTMKCEAELKGHEGRVCCVHVSNTGMIATASSDSYLRLFKLEFIRKWKAHSKRCYCCAFNPESSLIISAGEGDYDLKIWDLGGDLLKQLRGHSGSVWTIVFSTDQIASASTDKTMRIWDLRSGRCIKAFDGKEDNIAAVVFTNQGIITAGGLNEQIIKIYYSHFH